MKKYRIIYDTSEPDPPKPHELHAADIVANFFDSNIIFTRKTPHTTPDLYIVKTRQVWELKSPLGNGKRTMANNLRDASVQSKKMILDLTRCKMSNDRALSKIRGFLNSGDAKIDELLVIDKGKRVIDFYSKKR